MTPNKTSETKKDISHYPPGYRFEKTHLTGIKYLSEFDIRAILDHAAKLENMDAQEFADHNPLKGRTQINLFFENSTRTQASFELAGQRLGANILNMSVSTSSVSKGETLIDTAVTLNAMHPDILVVRHFSSGAADLLSQKVNCAVINAGDGTHEHPSQALLDAYTIRKKLGYIARSAIVICGDILHSRVARSNLILLNALGAQIRIVAPPTLIPAGLDKMGCTVHHHIRDALDGANIIMMLRLQKERMQGSYIPSAKEYYRRYGLSTEILEKYAPNAYVMHPGPVNRGIEIQSRLVDDPERSLIRDQVENGVTVRTAIIDMICAARRHSVSDEAHI
ncbi:MAG: aspartate carbamoyltransferase catalytic subunit [Pseudomonadota bacterium]